MSFDCASVGHVQPSLAVLGSSNGGFQTSAQNGDGFSVVSAGMALSPLQRVANDGIESVLRRPAEHSLGQGV